MNILIIDDEEDCCFVLENFINKIPNCYPISTNSGIRALMLIKEKKFDLIFCDVSMPDLTGIELLNILNSLNKVTNFVLISGKEDIIKSINAIDIGAYDFLIKPLDIQRIREIIEEIKKEKEKLLFDFNINNFKDDEIVEIPFLNYNFEKIKFGNIPIYSRKIQKIIRKLEKLHNYPLIPVLIEGESGVGKEIIARYIHFKGKENNKPFIAINCANINKDLFESELFGYTKGAFTGANITGKDGYIKLAENGTLFFDEISEIPYEMQSKLLRVLQENEYYKVGAKEKERANCRFLFASNKNIKSLVKNKLFREDLYYRISSCKIRIPPLRQRKESIIPLAFYFINELNKKLNKNITKVEVSFLKTLQEYNWPGNIRQLKNIITNVILFNEIDILTKKMLILKKSKSRKNNLDSKIDLFNFEIPDKPFDLNLLIKEIIKKTLKKFNGNKTKAAKFLNISRIQLYKRYKVD